MNDDLSSGDFWRAIKQVDQERRQNQLKTNLEHQIEVEQWCDNRQVRFRMTNEGTHWQFLRGAMRVEWWPSNGKLVINKQYKKAQKVHSCRALLNVLNEAYPPGYEEDGDD